jgi:type II secretory pathway pseudopilin PulG
MSRHCETGFTLVETMVGAAIAAMLLGVLVAGADRLVSWANAANARVAAQAGSWRLIERLSSEAASAWAVYVPANDVLGQSNADGHEVDFFSEDGSHNPYLWTYTYDAASNTITRYTIEAGAPPVAGDAITNIDSFVATPASVTQLGNPASPAYDPLFSGALAPDVPFSFSVMPNATGGNRLVAIQLVASGIDRNVLLASEDAPTAFTVVVTYTPSPAPIATPTPSPLVMTTP